LCRGRRGPSCPKLGTMWNGGRQTEITSKGLSKKKRKKGKKGGSKPNPKAKKVALGVGGIPHKTKASRGRNKGSSKRA